MTKIEGLEADADSCFFLAYLFLAIQIGIPEIIGFLGLGILLFCSAMISGSEIALFSLTPSDQNQLSQENTSSSKTILKLLEKPRKLLATILIGNTLVNVAIIFIASYLIDPILIELTGSNQVLNTIINLVGITTLLVLFGEIAPKVYANSFNIQLAKFMARPLNFLSAVLYLPSISLVQSGRLIERLLQRRIGQHATKEDIDDAIDLTVSRDEGSVAEANILKSIVKFGEVTAKQIMQPRVDVVGVDKAMDFSEVLQIVKTSGFSRMPVVIDNDFDQIAGLLYIKDLLGSLQEAADFEWQSLIREDVLYVPESKKIDDLLEDFQAKRMHFAVVVDEYGGSSGIVTLEDVLEEILGDIKDEFDDIHEEEFEQIDKFTYSFDGKVLINDMVRIMHVDNDAFDEVRGDSDSLAGLILEINGNFPKVNDVIEYENYKFKIASLGKKRIERVIVYLPKSKS